jgi:hypothetical protein
MRRFVPIHLVPLALVLSCSQLPTDDGAVSSAPQLGVNGSDNGTACVLNTQLRPENETPPTASEAKGHAQIKLRNDGTLEYDVFILNKAGETFVAGHIHRAPEGTPGPVVLPLFTGPATTEDHIRQRGEVMVSETFAQALCEHPEQYYVNYHTVAYPGGAIRGQLP